MEKTLTHIETGDGEDDAFLEHGEGEWPILPRLGRRGKSEG